MRIYKIDKDFNHEFIGDKSDFAYLMSLDNWYTTSMISTHLSEIEKYGNTKSRKLFFININHNFIESISSPLHAIKNKLISDIRNKKIDNLLNENL